MTSGGKTRAEQLRRLEALRGEVRTLEEELHPARGALPSILPAAAQSQSTDDDVSCRVLVAFIEDANARGLDPGVLAQGSQLAPDDLLDPEQWITWEQFCVVCRNLEKHWSAPQIRALSHALFAQPVMADLGAVAQVLPSVLHVYEWAAHRFFGPLGLLFRCVRFDLQSLGDNAYGLELTLTEGYRHNAEFFRMMQAWLEAIPCYALRPMATVSMEVMRGGAAFDIATAPEGEAGEGLERGPWPAANEPATLQEVNEILVERNHELERVLVQSERSLQSLKDSEKRFRILAELTNDYCYLAQHIDEGLVCDWITGSHARITGYGSGELLLMGVHGIVHADDRTGVADAVNRVGRGESVVHEFRILTRQGEVRWLRESLRPECFADGSIGAVYGAARDVTDRHNAQREQEGLEDQLRQSQKMDAVGRLAGGIAHDFNNLLTVVMTHVGFLLRELPPNSQEHDDAMDIQQAARRAAGLTQRLLTFSRQQVITPTVLELNLVVRDLESMLRSLVGEGIELDVQLDPRQSCISMDRAQLEQIVLNLVVNARDAISGSGGRVTLATGEVDLGEAFVRSHPDARPGRHVALGVRDTGVGMDEKTLARIFEPFFSTKPPDKGTGLGLSTVYGIVRQAGGSINVESKPGFGTTFEIYFPVSEGAMAVDPSVRPRKLESTNQETILVVEDEEGVRRGVQRILKHAGYKVLVAADPAQAITIVEEYEGSLDLLLTDVVMPMMNGVQLAARVCAMREDIRVLYMSGYTADSVDVEGVIDNEIAFLHKPFTRQAMLSKVADVLRSDTGLAADSA